MNGYELADFVPYDAAAWQSLYAQYMAQTGWVSLALAGALLLSLVVCWTRQPRISRALYWPLYWPVLLLLAACWAWLGWQFHGKWHQQFNWAAHYWAYAFVVQSALLLAVAIFLTASRDVNGDDFLTAVASNKQAGTRTLAILLLPWLLPPLAGWILGGRPPLAWEFVAAAPDPTAWFTVLILAINAAKTRRRAHRRLMRRLLGRLLLLVIPLVSLTLSAVTAWVTQAVDLLVVHVVAALSILFVVIDRQPVDITA